MMILLVLSNLRETEPTPEEIKQLSEESPASRPQQTEARSKQSYTITSTDTTIIVTNAKCLIQINLFYGLTHRNKIG